MKALAENLWIVDDKIVFLGSSKLEVRMTIVKLQSGGLWIHSPTKLNDELLAKVNALGPVEIIIAPNNVHHLFVKSWQQAFPQATVLVSSGVPNKIEISDYQVLDDVDDSLWSQDLQKLHIPGVPFFSESVFLHASSGSFIVTDLVQHHKPKITKSLKVKLMSSVFRILGFKDICIAPPIRWGFAIKDKSKFKVAIEQLQQWEFDRIVIAHGDVIEHDAVNIFRNLCRKHLL